MDPYRPGRQPLCLLAVLTFFATLTALPTAARAVDLDGLSHDVTELKESLASRVKINGYYSFEYFNDTMSGSPNTFRQHNFNLFIGRDWDQWRVLSELEFEDGPSFEGEAGTVDGEGGIKMEYAWFEYHHADALKVRGGKFLLPQYWNVNHYPPVVLSTTRPLMVRKIYPMDLIGLMLHGKTFWGQMGVEYEIYTGNGNEPAAGTDENENKAVGGHLGFDLGDFFDSVSLLHLGSSFYLHDPDDMAGHDVAGADLQFKTRRLELLAEYARDSKADKEGFYLQPAVQLFDQWHVFYRYGYLDDTDPGTARFRHTAGLNWRPRPDVSLKLEGIADDFDDPTLENNETVATSIALFF